MSQTTHATRFRLVRYPPGIEAPPDGIPARRLGPFVLTTGPRWADGEQGFDDLVDRDRAILAALRYRDIEFRDRKDVGRGYGVAVHAFCIDFEGGIAEGYHVNDPDSPEVSIMFSSAYGKPSLDTGADDGLYDIGDFNGQKERDRSADTEESYGEEDNVEDKGKSENVAAMWLDWKALITSFFVEKVFIRHTLASQGKMYSAKVDFAAHIATAKDEIRSQYFDTNASVERLARAKACARRLHHSFAQAGSELKLISLDGLPDRKRRKVWLLAETFCKKEFEKVVCDYSSGDETMDWFVEEDFEESELESERETGSDSRSG
ncbi:hypothetical protein EK21DRAFT_93022 [Setomelanomma holmii]|uniref:Uncharacterized protein n=1 Tax=Setomelanomma holmii TaxID=210430 RepID=A0A9P4H289_9PLEO|nr:hypothetical protein EK21DRAFT_93022 [Setomelanomma holmii]